MTNFRSMRKMMAMAATTVAMLAAPMAAKAALLDGSFELKGAGVSDYCYDGAGCPASPWTGSGVIASGSGAWGGTTTPAGSYYAFVQGGQILSQSFTVGTSALYSLSWLDAGRTNAPFNGTQTYTVSLGGVGLGDYSTTGGAFTARTGGSLVSLIAGTAYTVNFAGNSKVDVTSFIDNVSLSAVPETTTWMMMILGFGMMGTALRQRRNVRKLALAAA